MIRNVFQRHLTYTVKLKLQRSDDDNLLHLIVLFEGHGVYNRYCNPPGPIAKVLDWGVGSLHAWEAKSSTPPECRSCWVLWQMLHNYDS